MTRKHPLTVIFVFVIAVFCLPPVAFSQSATATLSGNVQDQNGAAVPGASVVVLDKSKGLRREVTTNDDGSFTVPFLPPSTYSVTVRRDGFSPLEAKDIVLNVGDQKALQIELKAGDVNAQVTVSSDAETVRTDGSVGTVVDRQFVANMPLNGRSLQSLISLTPGVVFTRNTGNNGQTSGQFSVNGQRQNANYFTLDGVSANYGITADPSAANTAQSGSGSVAAFTALGGTNSLVSIDALQEFKILTSSFAPEFGRTPGGQIQLLTRSGTNGLHGTIFDYLRNDVLDANDWFANRSGLPKAKERQNDFGGVIGGPIVKNRTFFFFSYEGLRLRQPATKTVNVPTIQARQQVADIVKPFINAYPIPNLPEVSPGIGQFVGSYSDPATLNATSIRVDHMLTQKMTLFGTYRHSPSQTDQRFDALNVISSTALQNDAVTVGLTWLLSASMTNDFRFNWSRARATGSFSADSFGGAAVPVDSIFFASPRFDPPRNRNNSRVAWLFNSAGRNSTINDFGSGQDNIERQLNFVDTLAWVRSTHQLKFGVDYRRISPVLSAVFYNSSTLSFAVSPQPTLNFAAVNVAAPGANIVLFPNFSAFIQDTWKATSALTLTYGLRWDLNPPPRSINGRPPSVLQNLGGAGPATIAPPDTALYKTQYDNFAPRLGLSYQVSRRPGREMVLRGGVGVFYDLGNGILSAEFGSNIFPYSGGTSKSGTLAYPIDPSQMSLPILGVTPPSILFVADPNLKAPYTVQWNAAAEQSLGHNQLLTVSYVGAAGRRLLRLSASTISIVGFPSTQTILTKNDSRSDYRALQVQFQRRLSRGVQALLSYALGRSYDVSSDDSANLFDINTKNLDREYGPSSFDVRHSVSGAFTVELPSVSSDDRVLRDITEGWGLDALIRFRTALPTNVTTGVVFFNQFTRVRPNVVDGVPQILYGSQYPGGKAVNPAAFVAPPANTQGNFPRNSLRLFNASQLDLALRRQFSLTERVKLQFRFEFFNVFNHPNFTDPTSFQAGSNVSTQMLSRGLGGLNPLYQIGGPRSGQVGLKFLW